MASSIQLRSFLDSLAVQYPMFQAGSSYSSPCYSSPMLPLYYGSQFGGGYGGTQRHIVVTDPRSMAMMRNIDREDRDENRASSAAAIGGIATLILSGVAAFTFSGYFKAQKELREAEDFYHQVLPQMDNRLKNTLSPIVKKHIEILETKCSHNRNISLATGLALGSAAAGFIGGMLSVHWLITSAIIVGLAATAFAIFCFVWQCANQEALPRSMMMQLDQIRRSLV